MSNQPLHILAVIGSLNQNSITRTVLLDLTAKLKAHGCDVDVLDFQTDPLPLYNPDVSHGLPGYSPLQKRVEKADVFLLGTPDYHGSMSSTIKSFLDHFWKEFAGKLFATVVSSHEKGLTVTDQLRTVARQCYAWSMPYGVSCKEGEDITDGKALSPAFEKRLEMMVRDIATYGRLLAQQRRADLTGSDHGFMARHRSAKS